MAVALAKRARTVLTTLARGTVANTVAAYRVTSAVVTTSEQGTVASRKAAFTKALRYAMLRCCSSSFALGEATVRVADDTCPMA